MADIIVVNPLISFLQSLQREMTLFDLLYLVWSMDEPRLRGFLCYDAIWPEGWSPEDERRELSLDIQEWQDELGKHATIGDVLNRVRVTAAS